MRYEHATIQMPPDLALLPVLLNEMHVRFGGELLDILPTARRAGVVTGNGRPPVQVLWTLVLRFPEGQKDPALAFVRGAQESEPPPPPSPGDQAGAQSLTMEGP